MEPISVDTIRKAEQAVADAIHTVFPIGTEVVYKGRLKHSVGIVTGYTDQNLLILDDVRTRHYSEVNLLQ